MENLTPKAQESHSDAHITNERNPTLTFLERESRWTRVVHNNKLEEGASLSCFADEFQGRLQNRLVTAWTGPPHLYVLHMSQRNALSWGQKHLLFRGIIQMAPIQFRLTIISSKPGEDKEDRV